MTSTLSVTDEQFNKSLKYTTALIGMTVELHKVSTDMPPIDPIIEKRKAQLIPGRNKVHSAYRLDRIENIMKTILQHPEGLSTIDISEILGISRYNVSDDLSHILIKHNNASHRHDTHGIIKLGRKYYPPSANIDAQTVSSPDPRPASVPRPMQSSTQRGIAAQEIVKLLEQNPDTHFSPLQLSHILGILPESVYSAIEKYKSIKMTKMKLGGAIFVCSLKANPMQTKASPAEHLPAKELVKRYRAKEKRENNLGQTPPPPSEPQPAPEPQPTADPKP